ncbi:hypothetical protein TVAG_002980 [Trichomonas vaginalis G3]|uniref:Uncharacterized protein n=1 Tax=Trichomonas vaginalis (strain ATCC PRA-98 / G3) TaxID=412133 RepID=A2EZS1_TRIV3|nr:hypothetical protein TVAGG3_0816450 [Trichomonas vaginalis G3]EAY01843.1 hypothetical protein TVAG_002980 [Trichomonas vaginalis G3]KAI5497569.1 hypothetical protein TVAGG3_0816450 [Trichomonas vaginalis G3]|eukprot:XP_001314390.1 hypothetical protein [Trichomonas vaginalis G3]
MQSYSDPKASRSYGWFAKGDDEVVSDPTFNNGFGTSMLFMEQTQKEAIIESALSMTAFRPYGPIPAEIRNVSTKTSAPSCRVQFSVTRDEGWSEFYQMCSDVEVTVDNGYLRFTTSSIDFCTVPVFYKNPGIEHVIQLRSGSPVTLLGASQWRCQTQNNNKGLNCSEEHDWEDFIPENYSGIRATMPNSMISQSSSGVKINLAGGLADSSDMREAGMRATVSLKLFENSAIILIVVFIILLVVYIYKPCACCVQYCCCCCNGSNEEEDQLDDMDSRKKK